MISLPIFENETVIATKADEGMIFVAENEEKVEIS